MTGICLIVGLSDLVNLASEKCQVVLSISLDSLKVRAVYRRTGAKSSNLEVK